MAIQNFLSGGFYGSIGELTGRRWKNKRVVQAKFKPANPKTPAQEAQRRLFTRGSALAKIAQQVNWKAPQFENPIRTDWNQRQTVAINALKNGASEWEALPLAPTDFKAQHIIGECKLVEISDDKLAKFILTGTNLLTDTKYACAIFIQSGEKAGNIVVGSGTTDAGSAENITIRLPEKDGIIGEECYIKIASYGDTEIDTVTLSAGIYLNQDTQSPYIFNPILESIELDSAYTLRIKVKLGQEAIENYDPFTDINIRIFDKAWTKETAVKDDKLDTDNWNDIQEQLTVTRTTVSKTTATITFACSFTNAYLYERFAAKIDISFKANNVKSEDSLEATKNIEMLSQTFPEYLQKMLPEGYQDTLLCEANTNIQMNGEWVMAGNMHSGEDTEDSGLVLYIPDYEDVYETEYNDLESVTLQDNKTYTGDELEELIGDYGFNFRTDGHVLGWGIADKDIKDFKGNLYTQFLFLNGKIAFKGYRVAEMKKDASGDFITNIDISR